jgi:hypothetical protein
MKLVKTRNLTSIDGLGLLGSMTQLVMVEPEGPCAKTLLAAIIDGSAKNQTSRTSGAYVRLEGGHARSDRRDRHAWGCHVVPSRSGASGLEGFRGLRPTFSWDSHHVCILTPCSVGPLLGDLL